MFAKTGLVLVETPGTPGCRFIIVILLKTAFNRTNHKDMPVNVLMLFSRVIVLSRVHFISVSCILHLKIFFLSNNILFFLNTSFSHRMAAIISDVLSLPTSIHITNLCSCYINHLFLYSSAHHAKCTWQGQ